MSRDSPESSTARRTVALALLLVVAVALVYARTMRFDFVTLDDLLYVTENPHIRNGITAEGIRWVFTHALEGNWHPLNGLSHMLDCELYGLRPGGHHLTNLALHLANSVLLFVLLLRMAGAAWPSIAVAFLFALHPLHVEPVAWVSGRKDLLSAFFGFLTIAAYVGYARRGGAGRYLLVPALLALALMAKPTLVSLPVLLLLLDYWPLGRIAGPRREGRLGGTREAVPGATEYPRRSIGALVVEKLPLVALAVLVVGMNYFGNRGAGTLVAGETVPFGLRLANGVVSYARYLSRTVWPADLAVHYQHPNLPGGTPWAWWQVATAAAVLAAVSAWVVLRRRARPYALVGWLWYLVALVPVLGLVQVGRHAMADRYTYVPLIGIFVLVAWTVADLVAARPGARRLRELVAAGTVVVLGACAVGSYRQTGYWRDSRTLYEHALAAAPGSALMHNNLGIVLAAQGATAAAVAHYRRALALNPDFPNAHNNLANTLQRLGKLDEAIAHYRRALEIEPAYASAHNNLAMALRAQGKFDEAIAHLTKAVELKPQYADAHNNLGLALLATGRVAEAVAHFRSAVEAAPEDPLARQNLAYAVRLQGESGGNAEATGAAPRGNN